MLSAEEVREFWEREVADLTESIDAIGRGDVCFEFAYRDSAGQMKALSPYNRKVAVKGVQQSLKRQRTKLRKLFLESE